MDKQSKHTTQVYQQCYYSRQKGDLALIQVTVGAAVCLFDLSFVAFICFEFLA